jgi:hypothetical protein
MLPAGQAALQFALNAAPAAVAARQQLQLAQDPRIAHGQHILPVVAPLLQQPAPQVRSSEAASLNQRGHNVNLSAVLCDVVSESADAEVQEEVINPPTLLINNDDVYLVMRRILGASTKVKVNDDGRSLLITLQLDPIPIARLPPLVGRVIEQEIPGAVRSYTLTLPRGIRVTPSGAKYMPLGAPAVVDNAFQPCCSILHFRRVTSSSGFEALEEPKI